MLTTTQDYKDKVNSSSRSFKGIAILDFNKDWNYPFATVVASTTAQDYLAEQACDGRVATTEHAYSGSYLPTQLLAPKKGWKGTYLSDVDGLLSTPESLEITYIEEITASNFWVISPELNMVKDFIVSIYEDAAWVQIASVTNNTVDEYSFKTIIPHTFTKIKIAITEITGIGSAAQVIEFGAITTVVLTGDDYLVAMELLEEAAAENGNPFGAVSGNECNIDLLNKNRCFVPSNISSPFYGLIRPKIRFTGYLALETSSDVFEALPLGVFKTEDWVVNNNALVFSLTGYDRLYGINSLDTPQIRTRYSTNLKVLFEKLFVSLGLTSGDYEIDASLAGITIPYGFMLADKVLANLQRLCVAGNCAVITNRQNKLCVRSNVVNTAPVASWTDDDQIISVDNPQAFSNTYSRIEVKRYIPSFTDITTEILSIQDLVVAPGITSMERLTFTQLPVVLVTGVQVSDETSITVSDIYFGANDVTFQLVNPTQEAKTIDLIVYGITLDLSSELIATNDAVLFALFDKALSVDNTLLQDPQVVATYVADVFSCVSDPTSNIKLEVRGDPSIEISDLVTVEDVVDGIGTTNVVILRNTLKWDGGLDGSIESRKAGNA